MMNLTEGENNLCIGENAGNDLTTESNQVRIGKDSALGANDMVIMQEGRVVISNDALKQIVGAELFKQITNI